MTSRLASGAASAAAFARSRTMLALVLKRSVSVSKLKQFHITIHTITSHARLSWNTGRNQDNVGTSQTFSKTRWCWIVALDCAFSVDVADIGSNTYSEDWLFFSSLRVHHSGRRTWSHANIVEGQLRDTRVKLHQKR